MSLREDKDKITYETRPKYLKNADGRIFIATDALIARGDLIAVDAPTPVKPKDGGFKVEKATRQQIVTRAANDFGVDLSLNDTLKVLRAEFTKLKAEQDASNNSDSSAGE